MDESKRREKHAAARDTLPDEVKPVFDDFVGDYEFAGTKRHGGAQVSYIVLAEMVRVGW